jgi:ribosomal protein L11 methyltransferase
VRWLELSSRVDGEAIEAVGEAFSRVAPGGIAVEPDLIAGDDDGFALGPVATVRAYVPVDERASTLTRQLEESLWHLRAIWPVGELEIREIAEADWAHAWKAHYGTFRVGRRIVIRPSWLDDAVGPDDIVVALDPGGAFGTGLHPTTRRCLMLLEDVIRPGDHALDVGTGSGILAIAAVGCGAASVDAVDVDPIAASTARANVVANGLAHRIDITLGSVDDVEPPRVYDVVIANIIARVIIDLAPGLVQRLGPHGTLVTAGIIADRADDVADCLADLGLELDRHVDGDWITLLGRRRRRR